MEKLLRSCYNEMNILGANTLIFEKRKKAIEDILNNNILNKEDYASLTNWIMGIAGKPEDILITLEKSFCRYDEKFTLQEIEFPDSENKEVNILCMVLLYQYCMEKEAYMIPLKILCGSAVGYRIKSKVIEKEFEKMVAELRVHMREEKPFVKMKKMNSFTDIKKKIEEAMKEEIEYDPQPEELKNVLDQVELCQKNINILSKNEEIYMNNMKSKSEESNIVCWMMIGWCECYQKWYCTLTTKEAALAIPFEFDKLVEFKMYPYAFAQMVGKMISEADGEIEKEYSLNEMIMSVGKELTENERLNFEEEKINSRIQPILYALKMRKKSETKEDCKVLFRAGSGNEMDDIKMSAVNFSLQLCRELELLRYMDDER